MPYNGAGIFTLTSGNPVVTGTVISSSWANNTLSDIANNGLTNCITKDGQTTPTANIPMGNFNFTGLAAPTGTGQALRWEQLQKGSDIASAATITIPNEGAAFDVTGTTTITGLSGAFPGRVVWLRFKAALSLTNSASLVLPNGKDLKPYPNEVFAFESVDSGVWQCVSMPPRLPSLYRSGGTLTPGTNTVSIAPGVWRSAGDETNIILTTAISKTLQSSGAWTSGTGNNGLFSGAVAAATSYHVFVIKNTTTGAVDAGFDTSPTAANIPSGWVAYRRVGCVRYTASNSILAFVQVGNDFLYTDAQIAVAGGNLSTTYSTVALNSLCPSGVVSEAILNIVINGATASIIVKPPGLSYTVAARNSVISGLSGNLLSCSTRVYTDTTPSVQAAATATVTGGFNLNVFGYRDFIGD